MRTNIDIDDDLMARAMAELGTTSKKATVEEALRRILRDVELRAVIRDMEGMGWDGDLEAMREGRTMPNPE